MYYRFNLVAEFFLLILEMMLINPSRIFMSSLQMTPYTQDLKCAYSDEEKVMLPRFKYITMSPVKPVNNRKRDAQGEYVVIVKCAFSKKLSNTAIRLRPWFTIILHLTLHVSFNSLLFCLLLS